MNADAVFMKAGNLRRLCELTDNEGRTVQVEPYAIFTSAEGRRCCLYFELGEQEGWRTTEQRYVQSMRLLEETYSARRDYEPFDSIRFPFVHYAVPTHDGRQRWADRPKHRSLTMVQPHTE
ncbi:MAG: hypothetical protein HY235_06155 [Acidobacteria bacterium]|nr:hypothetical protein [Acidobacteriota bacterium]